MNNNATFWKQVAAYFAIHTEILVNREGFLVVAASRWAHSTNAIFESNSSNVVFWFSQPSKAPLHFQNIIREVLSIFSTNIRWSMNHIRQTSNEAADTLVRVGTAGSSFLKFV